MNKARLALGEKAWTDLLQVDVDEADVHVCLAASAAGSLPHFEQMQLQANVGEAFRAIMRARIGQLQRKVNRGLRLVPYDGESLQGPMEVEIFDLQEESQVAEQLENLGDVNALPIFTENEDFIEHLRSYVLHFEFADGRILQALRLSSKKLELSRSKFVALALAANTYTRIENTTLLFDDHVDCLVWDEFLFILSKDRFQKIFRYFEMVREAGREALREISDQIAIENFNAFETMCEGNLYMLAKLRNIAAKDYLKEVTIKDIKRVISEFNLSVKIVKADGEERLLFDETSKNKWELLNLLDDAFLGSVMTQRRYEANSKRELP